MYSALTRLYDYKGHDAASDVQLTSTTPVSTPALKTVSIAPKSATDDKIFGVSKETMEDIKELWWITAIGITAIVCVVAIGFALASNPVGWIATAFLLAKFVAVTFFVTSAVGYIGYEVAQKPNLFNSIKEAFNKAMNYIFGDNEIHFDDSAVPHVPDQSTFYSIPTLTKNEKLGISTSFFPHGNPFEDEEKKPSFTYEQVVNGIGYVWSGFTTVARDFMKELNGPDDRS